MSFACFNHLQETRGGLRGLLPPPPPQYFSSDVLFFCFLHAMKCDTHVHTKDWPPIVNLTLVGRFFFKDTKTVSVYTGTGVTFTVLPIVTIGSIAPHETQLLYEVCFSAEWGIYKLTTI